MPVHRVPVHGLVGVRIDESPVKKSNPKLFQASRERTTNSKAISTTIPKMLRAHSTIKPMEAKSAIAELPRELRKARMADTSPGAAGLKIARLESRARAETEIDRC